MKWNDGEYPVATPLHTLGVAGTILVPVLRFVMEVRLASVGNLFALFLFFWLLCVGGSFYFWDRGKSRTRAEVGWTVAIFAGLVMLAIPVIEA